MPKIGDQLREALSRFEEENTKVENGNKAAGTRARKALMDIKNLAAEGRKALLATASEPKSEEQAPEEKEGGE
jgi:hypothetical protein